MNARRVALQALQRWRRGREFADAIAQDELACSGLSAADRAFALDLFYTALRNVTLLDFWLHELRPGMLQPHLRDIAHLGLIQVLLLHTAQHAAVFETVELAGSRQRTVINGILRSAVRRADELMAHVTQLPLPTRFSHPGFLIDKWRRQFGGDATIELCTWNNTPPPLYVRANRRIAARDQLPDANPVADSRFLRVQRIPVAQLERGEFYVQDPSTAVAPDLLDVRAGMRVLDACAAPGGKTTMLAEAALNNAEIVACDRDEQRLELLRKNMHVLQLQHVETVMVDWLRPVSHSSLQPASFDRILVDAPCSNTGVMRRRVDVRWRLTGRDFAKMNEVQLTITRNVIPLLKRGGVLVYSTCSIEPEENERVVERICAEHSELTLATTRMLLPFRDGFDGAFAARLVRDT